jgi:hypothetical protein
MNFDPQPGDTITIRTWDDMAEEYGLNESGGIKTPYITILQGMKQFCGHSYIVKEVYNTSDRRMYSFYGFYYIFPICALASYSPPLQSIPIPQSIPISSISFDSLIQPLTTP